MDVTEADQNKYVLPRVTVFVFIHKTEHKTICWTWTAA